MACCASPLRGQPSWCSRAPWERRSPAASAPSAPSAPSCATPSSSMAIPTCRSTCCSPGPPPASRPCRCATSRGAAAAPLRLLARHALNMVTGFSVGPLKLASLVGFASTLLGIGVLAYVVGRYLVEGTSVPGFPFLASVIAIFSGAQLFTLGILGEYLARMHL